MDVFFKQRAAAWMIMLLLVLNVATLSTIWYKEFHRPQFGPPRPFGHSGNVAEFLQRELQWNEAQMRSYENLRREHLEHGRRLQAEVRELRRALLDGLLEDQSDSLATERLLQTLSRKQEEIERQNYQYFLALKQLCGDEQKDKLRGLMDEFFFRGQPGVDRPDGGGPPSPPGPRQDRRGPTPGESPPGGDRGAPRP